MTRGREPGRRATWRRATLRGVPAAAVLAATLVGCTAGPAPEACATGAATEAPLTGTLTVFAAASLTETFDELAAEFEAAHPGVDVVLSYGGSSSLAEQIVQGAPADVFAAANEATMQAVVDAGLASDPRLFATNSLEIVVPTGNPGRVEGLADLARPELAVALCDPVVPCGSASVALLDAEGVTAAPDTLEQDVKAVLTKVELGEADAGLVYRTDAAAAGDRVEAIAVPEVPSAVNRYPIAPLGAAPNPAAAAAWVAFVLGPSGRAVLGAAGFGAP
ncbi:MAG: molybdate ABC transporter substrate-binding protein [Actinomycetales bacterium]|nr:molybdate ABC transporter substrate-binding protein [Actinomycetales bacterium]